MASAAYSDIARLFEILNASGNNYNIAKITTAYEYAAMLLLDYMLHGMEDVYDLHHKENEYFAVVAKDSLFKFTITAMNNGISFP